MDLGKLGIEAILAIVPIVGGAVLWLLAQLSQYFAAQKTHQSYWQALGRLNEVIGTVVRELQQTVVDEAKKHGTLDKVSAAALHAKAAAGVKALLGQRGLDRIGYIIGIRADQTDAYLTGKIESAVLDLRRAKS